LVLILEPGLEGWVEVPPFTSDMKYAASLVPDGLYTISRDPRIVCSTSTLGPRDHQRSAHSL
jgi:hypothetical protein